MNELPPLKPELAWAAYLMSAWWNGAGSPPEAPGEAESIVALLRRHGFPLLTLLNDARPAARGLIASPPFAFALEQDRDKMFRQQAAFSEIVAAWRNAGIPAFFVKAMGPLPSFPYVSNNLDVLVPQARQDQARKITRDLGYVELRHIEEPNKFLLRRFRGGAPEFDLHIHGRLEWHTEFVDSAAVWRRAAHAPDCDLALFPAGEDALLIALAHAAYENKAYKLVELAKFIYACRVLRVDWGQVAEGARGRGWLPGLWTILASLSAWERRLYGADAVSLPEEVLRQAMDGMPRRLKAEVPRVYAAPGNGPRRLPFVQSKRLFYEKMMADPSQSRASRAREIWTHTLYGARVRLRLRSQRPMLIALDGIDGCGKSGHAAALAAALEGAALRHRTVWTRGGSSRLLQPFLAAGKLLLGRGRSHGAALAGTSAREVQRSRLFAHPVVRAVWPWAIELELGAQWFAKVRWPLLRGEVVVADRYALSALVELAARLDLPGVAETAPGRLLRWFAPRPAIAYWLELPVETALARKAGDESLAFLAKQATVAGTVLAAPAGAGVICLDATRPMTELSDRIITEALRSYEDGHRTVLNAVFCSNPKPLPRHWKAAP